LVVRGLNFLVKGKLGFDLLRCERSLNLVVKRKFLEMLRFGCSIREAWMFKVAY
jgi:hypothetical protein